MLKPGNLPTTLTPTAFDDSLAEAIEDQLNWLLRNDDIEELPKDDSPETRDRRRMFVAIARGIMQHLNANAASIEIDFGGGVKRNPSFQIDWT
jgi:hypothetical protein